MVGLVELLVFAVVQGLSQGLPISSSAHLALTRELLNVPHFSLAMAAGLHGGSLLALIIWLYQDLQQLSSHTLAAGRTGWTALRAGRLRLTTRGSERHFPVYFVWSLVPLAALGFALKPVAERTFAEIEWTSGLMIANGLLILATAAVFRGERSLAQLSLWNFLFIASFQAFAVLPGISRLGVTICLGLFCRLRWPEAVRLALLYAIPATIGGVVVQAGSLAAALGQPENWLVFLFALAVVAVCGWTSLSLLTSRWLALRALPLFGCYCVMLGAFSLIYFITWQ